MEYAVEVYELEKIFPSHTALKGIDFKVPRGSIYGFLGPNGAGKTTTIKILLGLLAASRGRVKVLGEEVRFGKKMNWLKKASYLPQDPVFPESLTGKEVLELVGEIYRMERHACNSRAASLLQELRLEEAAARKVRAYSRGMKQRLGLAAALLTEPELLILDEPVSSLDPEGRYKILERIASLRGKATVFFSSHILADVEKVCDHLAIIKEGIMLIETETGELLQRYAMEQYIVAVRPGYREQAYKQLQHNDYVREVSIVDDNLLVTSKPGQANALVENLLQALVNDGIKVTEFRRRRVGLEEIFFKILEQNSTREEIANECFND